MPAPCCGHCAHFCNDPEALEQIFAGLKIMSSGHASVRGQDGLCTLHDRYRPWRDVCPSYLAAAAPADS